MKFAKHLIAALALGVSGIAAADYPERDITNVVVWGAGGGTDSVNRMVSAEMAKILGVNINVTNKTGGAAGSIGMSFVHGRPADGYTLVGMSESNVTAAVQGGWAEKMSVWYPFIVAGSPDIISVTPSTPYETLEQLVEAAKANPDTIKAAASGSGSIHHLNLLAVNNGTGAPIRFIPYPGSAPGQNAALAGEVEVVVTSLAEQQQLIRAGKLRPLAMLVKDGFDMEGVGTIPSAFDSYPELDKHLPISQAIGMAVRADAPDDVKATLSKAFREALDTEAVQTWAKDNFYVISGQTGDEASATFASLESTFAWTLHELGAAKINPEELGIPKP